MTTLALVKAFSNLPDVRRGAGQRHNQALCLALFTLAVVAGCRGFLAIGDWLHAYQPELVALFAPEKGRLSSYSTIRRVLLNLDYEQYAACLAKFFELKPRAGELLAIDDKRLRGSYQLASEPSSTELHPAIQLVSVYLVERGFMLEPYAVERKSNEIKVLPHLVKQFACAGVVFGFDALNTQKDLW